MQAVQAQLAFYFTGSRDERALGAVDELALRPALLAHYSDLTSLRYDFPIVLLRQHADVPFMSLTSVTDRLAAALAPAEADRARVMKQLARHEAEVRRLVAGGATGTLGKLWDLAARAAAGDAELRQTLSKARAALDCDGQVVDCDASLPPRLFIRAWRFTQDRKSERVRAELGQLVLRLTRILQADFAGSAAGRTPLQLQAAVGTTFENAFDFEQMSSILGSVAQSTGLSASRRSRIERVLRVLEEQRFFQLDGHSQRRAGEPYAFVYTSCADIQEAYRARLPEMVEVAKALAIAALEVEGGYDEARHDALFERFGANGLASEDLARFPDYLLWMYAGSTDGYAELMGLLGAGAPVKVLVQFDDLLEESAVGDGRLTLSLRSKYVTDAAIGLNSVFVMQSSVSNLVQMRAEMLKGLEYAGPALFSIYSGAEKGAGLPPYLVSAAAMESRAFPAFTYDPSRGTTWAARFSLEANPQVDRDWCVQPLSYEDGGHQRVNDDVAFTLLDYMACDARYAKHFAHVPAEHANGQLRPVDEWLARERDSSTDEVPCLMMVDPRNVLQKVIVDDSAIREARRCRDVWHSLQELGGIHNSHADRLLAREREAWQKEKRETGAPIAATPAASPVTAPAAPLPAAPATVTEAAEEKSSDESYIETPRCTTCEECVQINNKMFLYDQNKQAYIADLNAGSYRQLVEAAESCQVSIIHPGKPRNANEPGLEELIARAEPFL
jgi:hypothetical protein